VKLALLPDLPLQTTGAAQAQTQTQSTTTQQTQTQTTQPTQAAQQGTAQASGIPPQ
jgi:hypothetical protein